MEKLNEEKPDDLEITSIGALYRGHWDKKYWSSSRGRDRYPYPVGYQAIRTHTGNTYRMEIREGLKGPVFAVTSPDGDSCTGQTPDIAWENFQKKSCPRVKNWHGKRFSSKIDGVELFGFRNPFVQRLLRELVANVDGVAEKSSVAPTSSSKASKLDYARSEESLDYPNLLSSLGKRQITGRRSMKNRSSARNHINDARVKRARGEVLLHNAECNITQEDGLLPLARDKSPVCFQEYISSLKDGVTNHVTSNALRNAPGCGTAIVNKEIPDSECQNDGKTARCATSVKNCHRNEDPGAPLQMKAATTVDVNCHSLLAEDEILMESKISECFVDKHIIRLEQNSHISHENSIPTNVGKTLEKSFDADLEQRDSLTSSSKSNGDLIDLARNQDASIPDTCGTTKDSIVGSAWQSNELVVARPICRPVLETSVFTACEVSPRSMPHELNNTKNHDISKPLHSLPAEVHIADDPMQKGLVKDSLAEVSSSSGSSNPSSEKIDLELAGQELAKSMMTFLLPRAVPLLKKTYVKRRSRHRSRENKNNYCSPLLVPTSAKHIESRHLTSQLYEQPEVNIQEKLSAPEPLSGIGSLYQATKVEPSGSSKDIKSFVADSFEDDQYTHGVSTARKSPLSFDKADIEIKGDFEPSILLGSNSERASPTYGNDKCSEDILLPDANLNDENLFSDSLLDNVDPDKCIPSEQEFTNSCTLEIDQVSRCTDNKPLVNPLTMGNSSQPFNSEFAHNMEVDVVNHQSFPRHNLYRIDEAEHLADDTLKTKMVQSHPICSTDKNHSLSPNGQVIFNAHGATESRDAYFRHQVGAHITQVGHKKKVDSTLEGDSSFICMPNIFSSRDLQLDNDKVRRIPPSPHASKYCVPLSEIIICRNYKNSNSPQFHFSQKASDANENDQARHTYSDKDIRILVTNELKTDYQLNQLIMEENVPDSLFIAAMDASQNKAHDVPITVTKGVEPSHFVSPSVSSPKINNANSVSDLCLPGKSYIQSGEKTKALGDLRCSEMDPPIQLTTDNCCKYQPHSQVPKKKHSIDTSSEREDVVDSMELFGCYVHPDPVLSISLVSKDEGLQICVMCGLVESDIRNLFVYMVPDKEHRGNCPSFIGYTSLLLPLLERPCYDPYRNIPFERSGQQFSPAGQSLVFLNTVKAPRCREQKFDCSCMDCKSNYSEENIIEIVHVNFGYVTSVIKLVTVERVSCILACEPNYLIAVEQSGNLHVWMMNTKWSVNLEEFILPKFDDTSSNILELKRIPNCNCIIGHNGLGGFALWDISKRVLLAKFASPGTTTFHILPVGLSNCQSMDSLKSLLEVDRIKESASITDNSHPKVGGDPLLSSSEDDLAVWLLVSAAFGADAQHHLKDNNTIAVGWWRLAMLQRSMVVMGSILDSRASAVSTSSDYGIYGTCDGFMYKWELSSGKKLASLRPFTSGSVSGIAMDAKSGTVAVAGNGCQLLLYDQSQKQP